MTRYAPQWLQSGTYAASLDRRLIGALWPRGSSSGCAVTAAGVGMDLHVDPGQVAVPTVNATGSVLCTSDGIETVTLAPAPPAGTDRVDAIVCQPRSVDLDGTSPEEDFIFAAIPGPEGAPPGAPPATPVGTVLLATVHVAGGVASVVAADITDRRPGALAIASGGVPPTFASAAHRDSAWPAPPVGAECFLTDTNTPWRYYGGKWRGIPLGVVGMADAAGAWLHATYVTIISAPAVTFYAGRRYKVSAWLMGGNVTALGTTLLDLRDWGNPENRRTLYNGPTAVGATGGQFINVGGWLIWDPPSTQPRTFLIAGSQSAGEFRTGNTGVVIEDVGSP